MTVLPLGGGAGRILRGTEGLFKSDSEQARLSDRPPASPASALPSSTEVLAELSASLGFPAVSSSAGKIVQNEHKIRGEIKDKIILAQKQDEH